MVANLTTRLGQLTSSPAGGPYVGKNRIINGNMAIDQRNAGASVTQDTSGTQYTLDRWAVYGSVASKFTIQQNAGSITPPAGFSNYIGCTSSSAYAVASTDTFIIQQCIEGFNTADLNWGTANAKPVTFSAWVYSSLTGTFGGVINNSAFNYSYPFSYSIPVANTWTYITITIAGPTSGTWIGATNGIGMRAEFSLGSGSSVSGTAGAWTASGLRSVTGAVSVVGTSGATFYFTGVQLEAGTIATPYEFNQYSAQLAQCQRYYEVVANTGQPSGTWACYNTNQSGGLMYWFKVTKRANPSVSIQGLGWYYQFGPGPGVGACDVIWNTPTVTSVSIGGGNSNGLIAMYATQAYPAYGYVTISAEL